ncbi:hypothetical protein C8F04DRAFT_1327408 [Mycena alexandri]|uniref:CCHC-type domain-containing protein n=1 Tax=Mycena alexandri TaxID=1745969 RepID=A0AAD6S0Q3_9AGAR|nr:hypothetical protein C8F04DRAFT_1327408 [Mycena alexandri]
MDPEEYQRLLNLQRQFEEEEDFKAGPQAGPSRPPYKSHKSKGDPDDSDAHSSGSSPSSLSSSGKPERPERMPPPPPPHSFSAPLRTTYDMPIRGSKDAPKTFRGKYTDVQRWVDHYEQLLNKCRIIDEQERCEHILAYCSIDVQNVIQTMESFERSRWTRLKKEILRHFDAERVYQKYKPADVEKYAMKKRQETCYSLTQWRKYFIKYNSIAGGPLTKGYLSREDYNAYFLIGIQRPLRQILENRILQANPYRNDEAQYTIREINEAAEWYFRRNRYESLMVRAADLGEELDDDFSGNESDSDVSGSDDDESDYDEFLRKKKQRAKKKKQERTKKVTTKKVATDRGTQKFQGNEEEIAGMIRKLNAMRLDDPEYAPIYYKVMVMDSSGTAEKCVKPPVVERGESARVQFSRPPPLRPSPEARANTPASYPNNIPLAAAGANGPSGAGAPGCFGCDEPGHRISECRRVGELLANGVIVRSEDGRRLIMSNGAWIRRNIGESLVSAAGRIAAANTPRVMLNYVEDLWGQEDKVSHFYQLESRDGRTGHGDSDDDDTGEAGSEEESWKDLKILRDRRSAVSNFYRAESRRAQIVELESSEEESTADEEEDANQRIYLTMPRQVSGGEASVNAADRTEPSTRKARRFALDGVYPPRRERPQRGEVKDLHKEAQNAEVPLRRERPATTEPAPGRERSADKISDRPTASPKTDTVPNIQPFEARRVRSAEGDIEMPESGGKTKKPASQKKNDEQNQKGAGQLNEEEKGPKPASGRQSELSATVDKKAVLDRIMDTQIPMSLRELFVTSKEIRTEIQDLIKVKNVRAVLLGSTRHHPLIASLNWPREEGVLIKIDMTTNGKQVCAIIDTGSQLDVVRADIAALFIGRSVDMSQVTNMKDANGGRGQLQGQIQGVEFNCGGVVTSANLWVSQKAPFELLLGRPWQRGNLVSIDERAEGTYLIFKDRETRKPRYELLAVPYDGPMGDFRTGGANQYQSFVLWKEEESGRLSGEDREWKAHSSCLAGYGKRLETQSSRQNAITERRTNESGSPTHPASAAELAVASWSLVRAFIEVWTFIVLLTLNRAVTRPKPHSSLSRPLIDQPPVFSSHPRSSGAPVVPEQFQYLSRQTYSEPPVPVVRINNSGPIDTVEDAVARQWKKIATNQPIDVDPTFSAAPQSEYYGSVTLPNGQELHRSSAQNVFRVFRNRETGLPYTLSCHEFSFHLTTPRNPHQTWNLELVYPNNTRLFDAMKTMSPLDADDDVGFPVHATQQSPPLVPMAQRLRLPMNIFADSTVQTVEAEARRLNDERGVRPEDTISGRSDETQLDIEATNTLRAIPRPPTARHPREEELDDDVHRRAQVSLSLDDDIFHANSSSSASASPNPEK